MKRLQSAAAWLLAVTIFSHAGNTRCVAQPLPASLDRLYPPAADRPLFRMKMLEMSGALSGILVNMMEHDSANVLTSYDRFRTQFREVAGLVPEWKAFFPQKPVDDLGKALRSGNPSKVMAAAENLGKSCNGCHARNMVPVQHKYHWKDFQTITVHDPLSGEEAVYPEFKHMMDANFAGIGVDLQEGQRDLALRNLEGFKARFGALKEVCAECHNTERKYYVDPEIDAMVDSLGAALQSAAPDPARVLALSRGIGEESCSKCHLVHVPAAMARTRAAMESGKN